MLSLYIHIPFCNHKCGYCSFHVIPGAEQSIITNYLDALHRQIDHFSHSLSQQSPKPITDQSTNSPKPQIRTIYFGGGTPSTIGSDEMIKIIDHIAEVYDLEYLEELSIEINPEPVDEMLDMIQTISKRYKNFLRVRFSIGIQSFDNEVLEESNRKYNFQSCVEFLRKLVPLKMDHNVFNFDFIAFGKFNTTRKGDLQLRNPSALEFFQNFVESDFADSFSLYTLELFEGSDRYNQQIAHHSHSKAGFGLKKYGSDDDVYEEFQILKGILLDAGYQRYEISNYSKAGKNSIHNRVYRSMGEWLGLGTGATSHLDKTHFTTTSSLKDFIAGNYIDEKKTEILTETDYLKEKFIMGMRTMEGIQLKKDGRTVEEQLEQSGNNPETILKPLGNDFTAILSDNREEKIVLFVEEGLCERDGSRLRLTDTGMDVYNSFVTEIIK